MIDIERIMEIEEVKKEADKLMIAKVTKYENEIAELKKDVPVKDNLDDFILKNIDKDKLFNFLREMEFNRLLSSVISLYGEPNISNENCIPIHLF